jgi:hypothetical protein
VPEQTSNKEIPMRDENTIDETELETVAGGFCLFPPFIGLPRPIRLPQPRPGCPVVGPVGPLPGPIVLL